MILIVALFRMARFIMLPSRDPTISTAVVSLIRTVVGIKRSVEQKIIGLAYFAYRIVEDTLLSFMPLVAIYCTLLCWSIGWCVFN